jgi:parallel beta-helix repeat protein
MCKARLGSSRSLALVMVLTLTLLVALSVPALASAATLRVRQGGGGGYYPTIQAAVNAAKDNDVILVYPGTYNEGVDLSAAPGNISIYAVDSSGTPTPGTVTVNGGAASAFYHIIAARGDVTIDGFVVTSTGSDGIHVGAEGDVVIENVTASGTGGNGILVAPYGDITVRNCTANNNSIAAGANGVELYVHTDATVENCTANNNHSDGILAHVSSANLSITGCIARGNGDGGIMHQAMTPGNTTSVKGNIMCGNPCGLSGSGIGSEDAEGNWWGCSGGPGSPGCDTICGSTTVIDFTPWISTYTADATPGSGAVGQPVQISFQFSDSGGTMFLPKGPGDLNGSPTFTLHTDNGTLTDSDETGATVHEFIGSGDVLSVTLVPDAAGTATVTVDGPCELAAAITIDVSQAEEFVPEPGSVILLASGLMGLAGYASLRWRSKD